MPALRLGSPKLGLRLAQLLGDGRKVLHPVGGNHGHHVPAQLSPSVEQLELSKGRRDVLLGSAARHPRVLLDLLHGKALCNVHGQTALDELLCLV